VFRDSKRLGRLGYPVTLDLRLVEPDQVGDGIDGPETDTSDDGVVCDADGEVVAYKILKAHPGDSRGVGLFPEAQRVDARNVLQWFQPERPGQLRGVTPLAPSLGIFSQLRRFTTATLTAAEVASYLSGVLELPDAGLDAEQLPFDVGGMDTVELVKGMLLTVPGGGRVSQFKPEQPTTNYQTFVDAKLREAGRCLNVPFGKMAGDHSRYNYSSGRMDDAPYWHDREIERSEMEAKVFRPLFWKWCEFAALTIPRLAAFKGQWWALRHAWHYDAKPSSDPVKDATGDELNLTNGSDTLAGIAARDGTTTDALLRQRRRDLDLFAKYGLPLPPWATGAAAPPRAPAEGPGSRQEEADALA
jgi:capsid protein